jgi:methionine-rich copper-binding protein CopC
MKAPLVAIVLLFALAGVAHAELASLESRDVPLGPRTLSGATGTPRFNLVGLHWRGSGSVLFRTRSLAGRWSRWRDAEAKADERPDRLAGEGRTSWRLGSPFWTGASNRIQYRLRGEVRRLRAHFVWSKVEAVPTRVLSLAGAPAIIPRSAWGANQLTKRRGPRYADRIGFAVVHHTAGGNGYSRAQSAAIVRAIQVYHVKGNGWDDVGYNFLVDKYGQVFEGRAGGADRNVIGAHAQGFNTGSTGVAILGSYQGTRPSAAAEASLAKLIAWRLDVAHVDPLSTFNWLSTGNPRFPSGVPVFLRAIVGHRDVGFTDCPGSAVYARFGPLVQAVARTGLPKLYAPRVSGRLGGKIRFAGRLSSALSWTITVKDAGGRTVASETGVGPTVGWTWDSASARAGVYSYAIEAPGVLPARGSLGRKGTTPVPKPAPRPAPTPALLSAARAVPSSLTPDGDGRDDAATVTFSLAAPATVTATLTGAGGVVVSTLMTELRPAGQNIYVFMPQTLASGTYAIVLTAVALNGRTTTATVPVSVNPIVSGFASSGFLFSPNGDGRLDTLEFRFGLASPAEVKLRVLSRGLWVATVFAGALEAGPQALTWDGRKRLGRLLDGRYEAELVAPGFVQRFAFASDTRAPRLRLLRLRPARLSVSEASEVLLTVDGRRRTVRRDRAGAFAVPGRPPRRVLRAVARDAAGNVGRPLLEVVSK